jgi:hypothetical protein
MEWIVEGTAKAGLRGFRNQEHEGRPPWRTPFPQTGKLSYFFLDAL